MAVDARAAYVALALTPGIGAVRLARLLHVFETPDGALSAPFAFLCSIPGLSRAAATAVCSTSIESGQRALRQVAELGGCCLMPDEAGFPPLLREIPDPPTLLFALGDLGLLERSAVAVVGSRDHSEYGAEVARVIVQTAVRADLAVVSGMARGLDAVAHHAALEADGATIGVLGNGLGVIYPAANRKLYERVAATGLLLTEFPPGERPQIGSFPRRNRLISGLARVIYVHFEELFGRRASVLHKNGVSIVAEDSSEPDLNHGQIGRNRYEIIEERFSRQADLRIFVLHHHLLPIPGTGRERNIVYDAGDLLEVLLSSGVNLVLAGHKHVPYAWRLEDLFVVTTGTVSTLRLRGHTRPCYNMIEIDPRQVRILRMYPFDEPEPIIVFSRETPHHYRKADVHEQIPG